MRLPIKSKGKNSEIITRINNLDINLKKNFENSLKNSIVNKKIKVMLADFSVIETTTFEVENIIDYFSNKEKSLKTTDTLWKVVPVQSSKSDDLYRIYFQASMEIEKLYFYIYFGIQFHSLLYYKVDKKVIEMSKKIREIEEKNFGLKSEIALKGDQIIKQELETLGYKEVDDTKLFEELFTKQDVSQKLIDKVSSVENKYPQMEQNYLLLNKIKNELDSMITEVYKVDLVSLDNNSVMRGEEGMVYYTDLEYIKNKKTREKTSVINYDKIDPETLSMIEREFNTLSDIFTSR